MKLTSTQNRVLGALLFASAFLLADYFEGTLVGFVSGAMAGTGIILLLFGNLRPKKN